MPTLNLNIKTQVDTSDYALSGQPVENMTKICKLLDGIKSGHLQGTVDIQYSATNPVAASGTLTLSSMAAAATCVVGSETFTASSTPSGEQQFEIDGNDTADAAALAAAINAHSTLSLVVSATSSAGVVTITCLQKGVIGNEIKLTGDTGCTASGAYLTGGTGGAASAVVTVGR